MNKQYEAGRIYERAKVYKMAEIIEYGFKALEDTLPTCDHCGKKTNEANEMEDGSYYCDSCYQDAVSAMEYAYESYRENEVTGN